jgi:hypothetical protein
LVVVVLATSFSLTWPEPHAPSANSTPATPNPTAALRATARTWHPTDPKKLRGRDHSFGKHCTVERQ